MSQRLVNLQAMTTPAILPRDRLPLAAMFRNSDGSLVDGTLVVVPIYTTGPDGAFILGTGFFIGQRLLVTAKHVLFDGDQLIERLGAVQFLEPNIFIPTPVLRLSYDDASDVALVVLAPMSNNATGENLRNPQLALSTRTVQPREFVATFTYARSRVSGDVNSQAVHANTTWEYGHVVSFEARPEGGFGFGLGPCYETTLRIEHKGSGGPVADKFGHVVGINSTGFQLADDQPEEWSRVSSIKPLLALAVTDLEIDGVRFETLSVADLAKRGLVQVR
jgi:S1-C subfamily serine protease